MTDKVIMYAPAGTDEANIGVTRYAVPWRTGAIEALPEHVALLRRLGFVTDPLTPGDATA